MYNCNYDVLSLFIFLSPEEGKRKVLQLKLSEVVVVGTIEGSSLTILFSSSLDILQAARSVFGRSKNKVGHGSLHLYWSQYWYLGIFIMFLCDTKVCKL